MKKIIAVMLIICLCLAFSGCTGATVNTDTSTDEFGNTVFLNDFTKTTMLKTLPFDLNYNGKPIKMMSVESYEDKYNHSYSLFVVITVDVSELTDDEIYWMQEEDVKLNTYVDSEDNEYDFKTVPRLGSLHLTDEGEIKYVFSLIDDDARYSFSESEVIVNISSKQKDTYEYKGDEGEMHEINKSEELQYSYTLSGVLPSAEKINKPLYDYMAKWVQQRSDSYSKLFND